MENELEMHIMGMPLHGAQTPATRYGAEIAAVQRNEPRPRSATAKAAAQRNEPELLIAIGELLDGQPAPAPTIAKPQTAKASANTLVSKIWKIG